jgi:hypothetical protein
MDGRVDLGEGLRRPAAGGGQRLAERGTVAGGGAARGEEWRLGAQIWERGRARAHGVVWREAGPGAPDDFS